jgi:hypothetical protein
VRDPLETRLRAELRTLRPDSVDADRLLAEGDRRARRRATVRTTVLAAAACVAIAVGVAGAVLASSGGGDDADDVVADDPDPVGPSQSRAEAERDGVVPELAALPLDVRAEELLAGVPGGEGEQWVLARPGAEAAGLAGDDCTLGDDAGVANVDRICVAEYGEVLRLGEDGTVARAYPMPGLVPTWLHVADRYVYAGREGDGGLPASSLVRIDRASGEATILVLTERSEEGDPEHPSYRQADAARTEQGLALVDGRSGATAAGWTDVESWTGPLVADIPGIDELLDGLPPEG